MISKYTEVNESSICEVLTAKVEVQNLEDYVLESNERIKHDLILTLAEYLAKSKYLTIEQVKNYERMSTEFTCSITVCEPNTKMINRTDEMFVIETTNGVERFSEIEITEALMNLHPERFV